MSGTSLDGVDAALVEITGCQTDTKVRLVAFATGEIPAELKREIKAACNKTTSSVDLICSLNVKLGYLFADAVKKVCREAGFPLDKLDFIASHGQTIWHIPRPEGTGAAKSTLQIGDPSVIAYETGVQVVSNFRTMDIAAGGDGAPLVPYSEFILYGSRTENVALQNIGGIGNVTVIPRTGNIDDLFAFDTGPGNMVIDEACQRLLGKPYDAGGGIAASGTVNDSMLEDMMDDPYLLLAPPKSTGREVYGEQYTAKLLEKYKSLRPQDIIATVTMFTAKCIAVNYKTFVMPAVPIDRVVIGGGGAHNKTLLNYIRQELPAVKVITQEDTGFSSDAKEAVAFAVMGNETLHGNPSNVPSATGAREKVILGNITPVPYKR